MERFIGIIGIVAIFLICYALSNNKKAINYKTIGMGFLLQLSLFTLRLLRLIVCLQYKNLKTL